MEVTPGGLASAALSVVLKLLEQLVTAGTLSREDALEMLDSLIYPKDTKSWLHQSPEESEAAP